MPSDADGDTTVKDVFERASALIRTGDLLAAETVLRDALERIPEDGNLSCLLGGVLIRQRRATAAEAILRPIVGRFPDFAKASEELGNALLAQHRLEEALQCLERTLELEPDNDVAKLKLDKVRTALADPAAASGGQGFLQQVLASDPDNPDAYRLMGNQALRQGHSGDAVVLLRRSVNVDPSFVLGWLDLGRAHAARGDFEDALEATQRAAELEPGTPLPHIVSAGYLSRMGRHEDAIAAYNAGLAAAPGNRDCLLGIGHALRTIGRHDGAVTVYREAIRAHPADGEAYWSLANMKNVRFEPAEVQAMHEHLSFDHLDEETRTYFLFALGRASEDDADYERAFRYYQEGNAARRRAETYDPVDTQAMTERLIAVFDHEFFDARAVSGRDDGAPIFIVGLPRSGSTLIEQILASHSRIEGTRELPELERIVKSLGSREDAGDYPESVRKLGAAGFADLGRRYLEDTQRYRSGADYFTDKAPSNFRHVGLIHLILPNAKIVNARRHPLDSCLGTFKQLFAKGQPYSYDLFELGEYYLEYRRLMDHWHAMLPDRVLDVQYEDLVAEPEEQIRRLIDHCGLDWEDACLNFHETERPIESASSEQVRQPLYSSSVNDWRHYEDKLGELIEVLAPVLATLPDEQRPRATR